MRALWLQGPIMLARMYQTVYSLVHVLDWGSHCLLGLPRASPQGTERTGRHRPAPPKCGRYRMGNEEDGSLLGQPLGGQDCISVRQCWLQGHRGERGGPESQRVVPGEQKMALGTVVLRAQPQGQVCHWIVGCLSNHGQTSGGALSPLGPRKSVLGSSMEGVTLTACPRWVG